MVRYKSHENEEAKQTRQARGEYADGLERYVADIESGKTKVRPKSRSRFALT